MCWFGSLLRTGALLLILSVGFSAPAQSDSARIKNIQETARQILHENIRSELRNKDFCMACASNLADEYINHPDGHIKKLIDDALAGDQLALHELQQLPSSTPLNNLSGTSPSFLSKLVGGLAAVAFLLLYVGVIAFLGFSVFSKRFRAKLHQHFKKWNTAYKQIAVILGASIIAIAIFTDSRTPEEKACSDDWRRCRDNQQLIDTGSHHVHMAAACEKAASKKAKYGAPEFHTFSFSNYQPGREYVETGMVYLVERDALFQNMFGTKVHTEVTCKYDLNRDQVEDVVIWN